MLEEGRRCLVLLVLVAVARASSLPTATTELATAAVVQEQCPDVRKTVNASFRVNSIPIAAGWEFDVGNEENALVFGKVEEDLTAFDRTLVWRQDKKRVTTGKMEEFEPGTQIEVLDCNAQKVGTIKDELFGRSHPLAKFTVSAPDGDIVARTNSQDWSLTDTPHFVVTSADGQRTLATMQRSVLSWGQQWTITRLPNHQTPGDLVAQDPRVLAMAAAFLTASKGSDTKGLVWFFMIAGPICVLLCIYFCVRSAKAAMAANEASDGL